MLQGSGERKAAVMSTNDAEPPPEEQGTAKHVPAAELARRQGVRPVESIDDLARPDLFESDEELDEFLAMIYADRHTGRESRERRSI
jgi:hypothetical protein